MPNLDLDKSKASNNAALESYSIASLPVDEAIDADETEWINSRWDQQWGYFNANPKLKNAILMKAIWNTGKGWSANAFDKVILEHISGWGKDTLKDILFNLDVCMRVGGDSYAQIITHNGKLLREGGKFVNLIPMNPGHVVHILNRQGRLVRYEYKSAKKGSPREKFKVEEIFHLSNNRIANQTHGISDIDVLEKVILADNQSFENMNKICTFQAKPFIIFKLKTDNEAKINSFVEKVRNLRNLGDDMFVPDDENLLSYEIVQVNPSSVLMEWRNDLRNEFYRAIGLPQIIPGGAGQGTESESKVIYVAFEQIVLHDQLNIEQQFWKQLGIKINMIHPTLMEDLLGSDMQKDANNVMGIQKSELNPMSQNQS